MVGLTVIAIGGHSLLDPEREATVASQFEITARAVEPIADLIERGERIALTHGNGPQVGFMHLRSLLAASEVHSVPLDSLVADTQGALGYMLQRALRQALLARGIEHPIATIVTEVEVDHDDPAFGNPTKPIGLARGGGGVRRLVASPLPKAIIQLRVIAGLVEQGVTTISCGGGGIPVAHLPNGEVGGVEAVVDKDRTSALLAIGLCATRLVITTATDAIYRDFGTEQQARVEQTTTDELRAMAAAGEFPAGSMGPKVDACIEFLEHFGESHHAIICRPEDLVAAFAGQVGTTIRCSRRG